MKVTLGGNRLGSGKKEKIELQEFGRSSHDMSNAWRSTMSAGTLVPFMVQPALPGDVWDIKLDADVKTHPTAGPLFGSMKVQLDVFTVPMRLYNSWIHNNKLGIGTQMQNVKMPMHKLYTLNQNISNSWAKLNATKYPINPSHILNYLGAKGVGNLTDDLSPVYDYAKFNSIPLLGYWDIFKNYYANKQEDNAYVIKTPTTIANTITNIYLNDFTNSNWIDISANPMDMLENRPYMLFLVPTGSQDPSNWDIKLIAEQTKFYNYDGTLYILNR